MLLCGRIFSWCVWSNVLSSNSGAQGLHSWGTLFRISPLDEPFLSRILIWCHVPLEMMAWFDPNFPAFRRKDFLGWESADTRPSCIDSFHEATDLFHHFSSAFVRLTVDLSVPEYALRAEFASRFRFVNLTYGWMPIINRGIRTLFFKVMSVLFWFLPPQRLLPLGDFPFEEFLQSFIFAALWWKLQASPFEHCPFSFHW